MEQHTARIIPAPFHPIRYVNNGSYLPGDFTPEGQKMRHDWKKSIGVVSNGSPSSGTYATLFLLQAARALGKLKYGEKLFIYYGNN